MRSWSHITSAVIVLCLVAWASVNAPNAQTLDQAAQVATAPPPGGVEPAYDPNTDEALFLLVSINGRDTGLVAEFVLSQQSRRMMAQSDELQGVGIYAPPHLGQTVFLDQIPGLNEIMSLQWSNIDFDSPALRLPDSKTGAKVVHVGQPVVDLLRGAQRVDGNPWVITGTLPGKPLSDLQPFWQRVRARAGVKDVRIHDLRHTFASTAVASGQGLPMIGKLLGHTQVQTTARYAHLADDPVRIAADAVAQNLRRSLG